MKLDENTTVTINYSLSEEAYRPLMTVKIDGHEGDYVVVIYPHAN